MADTFNLLNLLLFLLSSGGRDLVSYIPPDAYWDAKGVEVITVDALLPELAPPPKVDWENALGALGSPDAQERAEAAKTILSAGPAAIPELEKEAASPDVEASRAARGLIAQIRTEAKPREVRRLMAIRTLGDLKDPKALTPLRSWLDSKEPFVAEYAAVAIARIEGKDPPPRRERDAKGMTADLELLPAACAMVIQLQPKPGLAPAFEDAIGEMELPDAPRQARRRQITTELVATAERLGNLRVDGMTIGVSGDFTGRAGFVVAVLRGQYDPDIAAVVARAERLAGTPVGGQTVYQWGPEAHVFMPSTDRAVFFAAPNSQRAPTAELIDAVAKGHGSLRAGGNPELMKMIDAADQTQPVWAAGKLTPELQTLPFLDGIDVLRITSTQTGQRLDLKLFATGPDATRVATTAKLAETVLKESLPEMEKYAGFMPPLRPARNLLRSIRLTPADNNVTGGATWTGSLTSLYLFAMYPYTLPADPPK